MIARYWSATTSAGAAPAYAGHLKAVVIPELKKVRGFQNVMLWQRDLPNGVEIVVVTFWESLESIRSFAGIDLETAVVNAEAAALLTDFDRRVRHYEVKHSLPSFDTMDWESDYA